MSFKKLNRPGHDRNASKTEIRQREGKRNGQSRSQGGTIWTGGAGQVSRKIERENKVLPRVPARGVEI